jgi:hypothetical protein
MARFYPECVRTAFPSPVNFCSTSRYIALIQSSFFTLSTKLKLPTSVACHLEEPVAVTTPITRKLQQEFHLVAPVSDVPDVTGKKMAVGVGHGFSLRECVLPSKRWR